MGLGIRRNVSSCFCAESCPKGTFPFKQYWIAANAPTPPHYGLRTYLFRFAVETTLNCFWTPVSNHLPPPSAELLIKTHFPDTPTEKRYRLQLVLQQGLLSNVYQQDYVTPLPEIGTEVDPNATSSCSRIIKLLPHAVLGLPWFALLTPAYPDACDDADFPMKEQTKPFAPF